MSTEVSPETVEQLANLLPVDEDAIQSRIDEMSDDELAQLLDAVSTDEDAGDEDIQSTTATQIAFARAFVDECTYDGDEVTMVVTYDDEREVADDEDAVLVVKNGDFGNHRAEWTHAVLDAVAEAYAENGNGAQYRKFTRENLGRFTDLARAATKDGIGSVLDDRGHSPDDVEAEF